MPGRPWWWDTSEKGESEPNPDYILGKGLCKCGGNIYYWDTVDAYYKCKSCGLRAPRDIIFGTQGEAEKGREENRDARGKRIEWLVILIGVAALAAVIALLVLTAR